LDSRIDKIEKEIDRLNSKYNEVTVGQAAIAEKINCVLVTMTEVKESIKAIQQIPSKRWETLITAVISAAVVTIIGFLAGKFL
ncbi:MAG TPA: hypothetical protein VHR42_03585, partial [Clostridia bacterium]|nr:hypothetical protein [Clostridia bacterium]